MKGLDQVARDFVAIFEQLDIPYALMGGLAVRIHALPRPTFDVDFTILIPRSLLPDLQSAAEDSGYAVPETQAGGWVDQVSGLSVIQFQLFLHDRSIDVDVFLAETQFQQQLLERRKRHAIDDWEAWFVTAEDLILLKLLANRPKDRVDIADILLIQGDLDKEHMRGWAKRLHVVEALEDALGAEPD